MRRRSAHARVQHSSARDAADGFTLVEILVVMVIIAILMGATVSALRSSKTSGKQNAAIAAAQSYGGAVRQFARDHGNAAPLTSTTVTAPGWPTAGGQFRFGPRDVRANRIVGNTNGAYLRTSPPEAVSKGWVTPVATIGGPKDRIEYILDSTAPEKWELRVYIENAYQCSVGDQLTPAPTGTRPWNQCA